MKPLLENQSPSASHYISLQIIENIFVRIFCEVLLPSERLSVTCSKVLMDDLTTSLLLICESEIQSIDTFLFYETNAKQQPLLALLHARVTSVFSFHFFVQCTVTAVVTESTVATSEKLTIKLYMSRHKRS